MRVRFRHERVDDPPCSDLCFRLPMNPTGDGPLDVESETYGPDRENCHVDVRYNDGIV